ncbi:MAG: hypothetical protein JW908_07270 [Anaerolineales bacterium]|nr:hypothetical protein [Anaerolineales bacterium]
MVKRVFFLCVSFTTILILFNGVISPQVVHSQSSDTFAPASIVKDINPGDDIANELGSHPRDFIQFNGNLYFVSRDREHGQELWKTDGTLEGTKLVKDFTPGIGDTNFQGFTSYGNMFYFFAQDSYENTWQLWISDGSVGGTACLKEGLFVKEDPVLGYPNLISPIIYNNYLFFSASLDDSIFSLWRSDGTSSGTLPIVDFTNHTYPFELTGVEDTLFFAVSDDEGGYLWKSDGTSGGTSSIYYRSGYSYIKSMVAYNGQLLSLMSSAYNSKSYLIKSDGTTAGTFELKTFEAGESGGLYNTGNKAVFFLGINSGTSMEAWISDGTSKNTKRIAQLSGDMSYFPKVLTQLDDNVFFATHAEPGLVATSKLYKSNSTTTGTGVIKDDFYPMSAKAFNGSVLFLEEREDPNLWKSDGTSAGTVLIKSFTASTQDATIFGEYPVLDIAVLGNSVIFGYDTGALGVELWKSDGTDAGTQLLKNIYTVSPFNSSPTVLSDLDGTLLFRASTEAEGMELWRSNATESGTTLVKDIFPGTGSSNCPNTGLTTLNSALYFFASDTANQCGFWESDGTLANTTFITVVIAGANYWAFSNLISANNTLYFVVNGYALWRSDGTAANTTLVKQIDCSPYYCGLIQDLVDVNGTLYFSINRHTHDWENADIVVDVGLWKSDGTTANTTLVKSFLDLYQKPFVGMGNEIYFYATDSSAQDWGLWRSDGTEAGTNKLASMSPTESMVSDEAGGRLFFSGGTSGEGIELWISDGTISGTVLLKDIYPGNESSLPENMAFINGHLLFSANDGVHGKELWVSDGTIDGTQMVKDIFPSIQGSHPQNIASENLDGWALFSANDGETGYELWQSNGTEHGTLLVQDIASGISNSNPSEYKVINDKVFFTADDFINGNELWAMDKKAIVTPRVDDLHLFTKVNTSIMSILPAIDPSGYPLTYTLVTNGGLGTAMINNISTGDFSYTPSTDAVGKDSFTFQVTNGAQTSLVATITVYIYKGISILPIVVNP